jgi:hypothetical protein
LVLAFAFHEVLSGVDEEHVVGLLALLEHENADGDAGGIEQVRGQADDGVDNEVVLLGQCRLRLDRPPRPLTTSPAIPSVYG